MAHAALGLAGAATSLEVLLFSYEKVPFTHLHPERELQGLRDSVRRDLSHWRFSVRWQERAALRDPMAARRLTALLTGIIVGLRVATSRRAARPPVDFDEAPVTTQQLGLHTCELSTPNFHPQ